MKRDVTFQWIQNNKVVRTIESIPNPNREVFFYEVQKRQEELKKLYKTPVNYYY